MASIDQVPTEEQLDDLENRAASYRQQTIISIVLMEDVDILIDEIRRLRHILSRNNKEATEMDLLSTTQGVVRNLKKFSYSQRIEVLELARKAIEFEEEGIRKAEAIAARAASEAHRLAPISESIAQ